jgi:hypothetical protein
MAARFHFRQRSPCVMMNQNSSLKRGLVEIRVVAWAPLHDAASIPTPFQPSLRLMHILLA